MLARGLLSRLSTVDATTTSAHDLCLLAAVLTRNGGTSRCVLPLRPFTAVANGALQLSGASLSRSYATATTPATKSAASTTAKGEGAASSKKKATGTKAAATKKKTTAKSKTAAKKKKTAKKAKKAAPKKKKELSEAGKERLLRSKETAKLKVLKATALLTEPTQKPSSPWLIIQSESSKAGHKDVTLASKTASEQYRNLSPAEREQLNHTANQNSVSNNAAYKAWVESHTPEQIRLANKARTQLRKIRSEKAGKRKIAPYPIKDERFPKRPRSTYTIFFSERYQSDDFKGIALTEATKLIVKEYHALTATEKKRLEDIVAIERAAYFVEYEKIFGHPSKSASASTASSAGASA